MRASEHARKFCRRRGIYEGVVKQGAEGCPPGLTVCQPALPQSMWGLTRRSGGPSQDSVEEGV